MEIGFYDGFSFYSNGRRESPEVADLRIGLREVYGPDGRLMALVPKGFKREMSVRELLVRARASCGAEYGRLQ